MTLVRSNSDKDLPNLLPIPIRPTSSHGKTSIDYVKDDLTREGEEYLSQVFPADAIEKLIEYLFNGHQISQKNNNNLSWVISDCLRDLNKRGFKLVVNNEGKLVYLSSDKSTATVDPPSSVLVYLDLAKRLRQEMNRQSLLTKSNIKYCIAQIIFDAYRLERRVIRKGPLPIMDLIGLLRLDINKELYLIHELLCILQHHIDKEINNGDTHSLSLFISPESLIPLVNDLLVEMEFVRINFIQTLLAHKKSNLLYCVYCANKKLADCSCTMCHDVSCGECFQTRHQSGHRSNHLAVFFEQYACSECGLKRAYVNCNDCADLFCFNCFEQIHSTSNGHTANHSVSICGQIICTWCGNGNSEIICLECSSLFCKNCWLTRHRHPHLQFHEQYSLYEVGYISNPLASTTNFELIKSIITEYMESKIFNHSPLFLFEENNTTYQRFYYFNILDQTMSNVSSHEIKHQVNRTPDDLTVSNALIGVYSISY